MNWSLLGKIGAVGAAPFTGGASLALLPAIDAIGRVSGNAAKGAMDQRLSENQQALQQSQIANRNAIDRSSLELQQKQFQQNEPSVQASQALRGSLMQHLQPLQMQGLSSRVNIPKMNSILDALGPEARQAGGLLAQRGVSGLQAGPTPLTLPPSMIPQLQKSGMLEKILGGVGVTGSMLGALGRLDTVDPGTTRRQGDPYVYRTPPYFPEDEVM